MIFSRFYENELKKAWKMKQEHDLEKKMRENILKKLNWQKKKSLKNNFINIKADKILFLIIKQAMKKKNKEKSKKNEKNKSNAKKVEQNQIDELILKFESLTLNLNVLSE